MSDEFDPATAHEARDARQAAALAMAWANGKRSHWNLILEMEPSSDARAASIARCAEADAAEVAKWGALARMLRSLETQANTDALEFERNVYENALRGICTAGDGGGFADEYRNAGGGYEGLQAIARKALDVIEARRDKAGVHPFNPDWTVHPGATLADWMEEQGKTVADVALACSLTPVEVRGILSGTAHVSTVKACKLQQGTGVDAQFWLRYERRFREDLAGGKRWTP